MLIKRFEYNFTGTIVEIEKSLPYYGRLTQSGDGNLLISISDGIDCSWWSGSAKAPHAIVRDVAPLYGGDEDNNRISGRINIIETRVVDVASSSSECMAGLVLFNDNQNAIFLGYSKDDDKIHAQKGYNDSFSTICSSATTVTSPLVTAHRYRIAWNSSSYPVSYDGFGDLINANTVVFYYSDDDGFSWTNIGCTYTFQFSTDKLSVGLYTRNWSPYPAVSAKFDYFIGYNASNEQQRYKRDAVAFEDYFTIMPIGGKAKHKSPIGEREGLIIPGHKNSTYGQRERITSAIEDDYQFLPAGDKRKYINVGQDEKNAPLLPGETKQEAAVFEDSGSGFFEDITNGSIHYNTVKPAGTFIPGQVTTYNPDITNNRECGAWEDRAFFEISDIDYVQGKDDIHGNEFLSGRNILHLFYYDASNDIWNSGLTGTGYYGAKRDGTFVYDGYDCSPGGFGTLASGLNNTAWAFDGIEPLSSGNNPDINLSLIADDKIRISLSSPFAGWKSKQIVSYGRWCLSDDFDVEFSWENFSASVSDGGISFRVIIDSNNYFYIRRTPGGGGRIDSNVRINNSWVSYVQHGSSATSGKFRITRSGNTLSAYYDTGGGWVFLRSYSNDVLANEVFAWINAGLKDPTSYTVDVFGFTINSGIYTNKAGWWREGFNTNRGLNAEFPLHSLVVCTESTVEIIDVDNDLLWMRFVRGGTSTSDANALHNFSGYLPKPRRAFIKNGMLLISYAVDDSASTEGGLIVVDFSIDDIRICRDTASAITGGSLRGWSDVYWAATGALGTTVSNGLIAARNEGGGYYSDRNNWQIKGYRGRDAVFYESSGYIYKAIATKDGLTVQKWKRWYLFGDSVNAENITSIHYGHWNMSHDVTWCWFDDLSGDLFFIATNAGTDTFYYVSKTTWEGAISDSGGTFPYDESYTILGTRNYKQQKHAVYYSEAFYVPSNDGVYKISWPSGGPHGGMVLFYGQPGSVATHDILNSEYAKVLIVNKLMDGVTPYLAVGVEHGDRKQTSGVLMAVNLITNELFAKSPIEYGRPVVMVSG